MIEYKSLPPNIRGDYYVYVVRCNDDTLYTGMTGDLFTEMCSFDEKRELRCHYLSHKRPVILEWYEVHKTRHSAYKRAAQIRRLSKEKKEALVSNRGINAYNHKKESII